MALHRGIQSAIFYYVSCTPCAEVRVRKRRKQEAERDRADRAALELNMPGLYQHPEPSATNPYWQAEIDAGPIPSRVKKRQVESSRIANSTKSNIASSVSVADHGDVDMERSDSAKSGLGVLQRQDEELWGENADTETHRPSVESDGLPRRLPRARLSDASTGRHTHSRNPAINDLHPPTTRKVESREDVMWMLQPPPLPEVMNGKDTQSIHRSNSHLSRPRTISRSTTSSRHGNAARSVSHRSHQSDAPDDPSMLHPTRSRTMPPQSSPNSLQASAISRPVPSLQLDLVHHRKSSRPFLSAGKAENEEPQRASSFNTGMTRQDHTSRRTNDVRDFASDPASPKQSHKLIETFGVTPREDSADEHISEANSPANFDAWQAPEDEFPQWIHEHTKREVRQRWSFDM